MKNNKLIKYERSLYNILSLLSSISINMFLFSLILKNNLLNFISYILFNIILLMTGFRIIIKENKIKKLPGYMLIITIFILILIDIIFTKSPFLFNDSKFLEDYSYINLFRFHYFILFYFIILLLIIISSFFLFKSNNKRFSISRKLPIIGQLIKNPNGQNICFLFLLMCSSTFFEELIFRYFLINIIASITSFNLIYNIALSSFIFSIGHLYGFKKFNFGTLKFLILCFIDGLLFSAVFITNGLLFAWWFHLIDNGTFLSLGIVARRKIKENREILID